MLPGMRITFALAVGFLGLGACYQEYQPATTPAPQFQPQPVMVQGPPGGEIDEGYAYNGPSAEVSVEGSVGDPYGEVAVDATATVTDAEINTTLEGYGYWVEDPEYGRIWRPDATVVGVDFTPYETCGSWVWTEYGWTYQCDWSWGWLPFHYGQWGWFDDYWAWVPDYTWSPAWVDWRYGNGYVGWRPRGPSVRDHRSGDRGDRGPIVRDHRGRRSGDADWRFVGERDFRAGSRIRPSLAHSAEGLRATSVVARPPIRANATANVRDIMKNRSFGRADRFNATRPVGGSRPAQSWQQPSRTGTQPSRTWQQPARTYQPPTHSWQQPSRPGTYPSRQAPSRTYQPPTQSWQQPSRTYTPPSRSGTYTPPSRTYTPPSRSGTYSPSTPSRSGTYSPPSAPSRSYSPSSSSGGSSRSSSPSSSGGSSRGNSSSSSHSSGGGRRR
jgi:hypothetical protein